jgi:uncharacterized protein (TIGR03790 family)
MFQFYRPQRFCSIFGFSLIFFLFLTVPCKALSPGEVLVVANGNSEAGMRLAAYYMQKRGIPDKNIVKLNLAINEVCSREVYEKQIAQPVRKHLKEAYPGYYIRCRRCFSQFFWRDPIALWKPITSACRIYHGRWYSSAIRCIGLLKRNREWILIL